MIPYVCTRGGLVTVVEALTGDDARAKATRRFLGGTSGRRWDRRLTTARPATSEDLAAFAALVDQDQGGVNAARRNHPTWQEQAWEFFE